jgi:peptidoglycan/LPS O-acetylase OafA/YrhL
VAADEAAPRRLEHQPALDGLRALAVIAVMVFHQNHLGGGFLGVDVFFVLSGFLITSLLLIDHANTGKIVSFAFWRRRVRRLFPALLVLLAITALYAVTVARPESLESIRREAFATLVYIQNYWVLNHPEDFRYPLAHTWSLSIEEQFYVVWPLLLAGLVWITRRRRWLVVAVLGLALLSAALMSARYGNAQGRSANFSTETRAHELLIGAALGIALLGRRVSGRVLHIAGTMALLILVVAAFTAGDHAPFLYRGGYLLIAVTTAVVITAAVSSGSSWLRAALSWKPLVWIGLISYGLYLYHFAMYGFVNAQDIVTWEPALVAMRFGLTIVVAAASYYLIEQPIRKGALTRTRTLILAPLASGTAVILILVATGGGTRLPVNDLQATTFIQARQNAPDGSTRVLMVGDALASSFVTPQAPQYQGSDINGVVEWTSGSCDPLRGQIAIGATVLPASPPCAFATSYRSAVDSYQPDVTVLAFGSSVVFDRVVDGKRLNVGTRAHRDWLYRELDALRAVLGRYGAQLVVTTVPCMSPPTTGQFGGLAGPLRDVRRVRRANEELRAYAADRGAVVADIGTFLCAHPDYIDATGVRLSPAGAFLTWGNIATAAHAAHRNEQ